MAGIAAVVFYSVLCVCVLSVSNRLPCLPQLSSEVTLCALLTRNRRHYV